jgi:hypothetical protein
MRLSSWLLVCASVVYASAVSASDATLFRIFLRDGGVLVSYGEFSRVDDRVVFSMPVGGQGAVEPRLQVVWVAADAVDWPRTNQYATSARYQQYVQTRGETEFQQLNDDVARVLNEVAVSQDRARALELATRVRQVLLDWPSTHQGYRQDDVREIAGLIDEAISGLRGTNGQTSFDIALVASAPVELEPLLGLPSPREQFEQVMRLAGITPQPSERLALLQTAQALLVEGGAAVFADIAAQREAIGERIRRELGVERRYSDLASRLVKESRRDATRANVSRVESALAGLDREDEKLGRQRPEVMAALRAAVQANLDAARDLRLRRDQWTLRQRAFQDYQRQLGTQILALIKAQPSLEAIRRLDGPKHKTLVSLQSRLRGGAERMERLSVAEDMRTTHGLLVGAWSFAENAVRQRLDAVSGGNMARAWEASSAAAGAIMMFSRAQDSVRQMLEPPKVQ